MSKLSDWFAANATRLSTLDPETALDELEPLRELVGDARVVAIGEGAHFVAEFNQARTLLARFLVERCGFTMLAAEYGFASGFATDAWAHGEGEPEALGQLAGTHALGLHGGPLHWLREYNASATRPVDFAGVDLPISTSLRPVLEPAEAYLRQVDPDSLPLVTEALGFADRIGGGSAVPTATNWAALRPEEQDRLTAVLARLMLRLRALEPEAVDRSEQYAYEVALRHVDAAAHVDYMYRAMTDLFAGTPADSDTSVRDRYMAESVCWHLDHAGPDAKIVLLAHNLHIQKTPVVHEGLCTTLVMGNYLERELGNDYRAIALTHTGTSVPEMDPNATDNELGFEVYEAEIGEPSPESVEGQLHAAGLAERVSLTDLRGLPEPVRGIRAQSAISTAELPAAFDAVFSTPRASKENGDEYLDFGDAS